MVSSSPNTRSWVWAVIHHQRSIRTIPSPARPISPRIQTCPPRCSHWITISTKHSQDSIPNSQARLLNKMGELVFIVQHSINQATTKYQSHQVLFGKSSHLSTTKWSRTSNTRQQMCKFTITRSWITQAAAAPPARWPGPGTRSSRYSAATRSPARARCPDPRPPSSRWARVGTPWPRWPPPCPGTSPWSATMYAVTTTCRLQTRDSAQSDSRQFPRRRLQSTRGRTPRTARMTPSPLLPLMPPPLLTPPRTCCGPRPGLPIGRPRTWWTTSPLCWPTSRRSSTRCSAPTVWSEWAVRPVSTSPFQTRS